MNLNDTIHKLWIDYLVWVRDYIYSLMLRRTGTQYIEGRLIRVISDFSSLFNSYYGDQAAERFANLLARHIELLSEFTATLHSGLDPEPLRMDFYSNSNDIARFLAELNPFWDETVWQRLLQNQFYLEESMIRALHHERYKETISQYDDIYNNIHQISSYMIDGFAQIQGLTQ